MIYLIIILLLPVILPLVIGFIADVCRFPLYVITQLLKELGAVKGE